MVRLQLSLTVGYPLVGLHRKFYFEVGSQTGNV